MFDRLQKPFLTVETGEAYQPTRLTFDVKNQEEVISALEKLQCIKKNTSPNSWSWYWHAECDDQHFESVSSFVKNPEKPLRLGTLHLRENKLFFNLPSFKRACLAVPFFHKFLGTTAASINQADFINKVFAIDERLPPHGFTELFKEEELDRILNQRISDFDKVKERCEHAASAEEAFSILAEFSHKEAEKRLPYAERYVFDLTMSDDLEIIFLAFYIFMRNRELVAIKRWYGQAGYTVADATDEIVEHVFGHMGIDIID